ncbi:type II toxin-antitoxin system VapC family toxin [Thermobifida halotolerans]|uniref:Type II toxin-antitoxin system VapC family toxin n=1 Tax=Thermobifida halotolerans TaxID=483545 RepID=A0A399G7E0_9ACTN|nr:type II toxin-antitoxin system VapC family toxin [Thermobifida halotolerans]UOE20180.1 type II toxin-antitoxin system VapC family toxin [Thermobifida halotolerans]
MIVIDTSALASRLLPSATSAAVAARVKGRRLLAPSVVDPEFAGVPRGLAKASKLSPAEAEGALRKVSTGGIPIGRIMQEPLTPRVWELRHNCSPHDAVYVAAAEQWNAPLPTCDAKFTRTPGLRCEADLVT